MHTFFFSVAGFLRHYGLDKDFRMNIEANHAELAGHDFHHELETAAAMGLFGSVDANRARFAATPGAAGTPTSSP